MKLALIGGGGARTPLVYRALLESRERLPFRELVLHDLDAERLARVALVLEAFGAGSPDSLPFRCTTDLLDAVAGADFVFAAIRVGQLAGRAVDEEVPLRHGVLGQETTGPGGIGFALRTIPAMAALADEVAQHAPGAWLINFTNPAGMITEAIGDRLDGRVVGICDSPNGLCARIAGALGRDASAMTFDYFGLNHLGWVRRAWEGTTDLLPQLLADDAALASFEEGALFDRAWLRTLGMVPNEYLAYYYANDAIVASLRRSAQTRARYLLELQQDFYADVERTPEQHVAAWRRLWVERERSYMAEVRGDEFAAGSDPEHAAEAELPPGYERDALAVVDAIANDTGARLILNTRNRSALPFLDERAVVEVPCVVTRSGPLPLAVDPVPDHAKALVQAVKAADRMAIAAAASGSTEQAVAALALHPLVPSVATARAIFDDYRAQLPQLAERFR